MDATKSTRKYPAYTTDELRKFVAEAGDAANPVMVKEIADRDAGISRFRPTPQVEGGMAIPRLGRM